MVDYVVEDRTRDQAVTGDGSAMPLGREVDEALVTQSPESGEAGPILEPGKSLVLTDFAPPAISPGERLIRLAYRLGVPPSTLTSPFTKPARTRMLATVKCPLESDRAAGVALRMGHFLIHGVKTPIGQMDFSPQARLTAPFERVVHGFSWLGDLAASAPREDCAPTAERVLAAWLAANGTAKKAPGTGPGIGKGPAWNVEHAGHRLLNWLVHAPLILSGQNERVRSDALEAISHTARWLDRNVTRSDDVLGEVAGWCAITAAGLLLPEGKPRRLFGEAGLIRALGELVADDGGVLSRSPIAQMDAIGLLVKLIACYRAAGRETPAALDAMLSLLVPPLLALMHGDGGLGSWQGAGGVQADRVAALIEASGVRSRPLQDIRQWGYQRLNGGKTILQFDAAPPPRARHARSGCASTLAFEMSCEGRRIIVNCGGAGFAGGQTPIRIEQGLRATAAHSTLALDNANSTAVMINGKLGKGVEEVEVNRRALELENGKASRVEASHDGYAARFGLVHRRILILRDDGSELRGEDLLVPSGKGKRGKIEFAIRFHIGPGIELGLSEDRKGAGLALPDGTYWQFRLGTTSCDGVLDIEESMWVDGQGRPQPIQQLVLQGLTSRSGGNFSWLLRKMG
ncbi:heparinase II/III family protein [Allopontixanthobacter sp.]|uniref:heparinase II/III family protein n=1 Tax=Allopontixanthobacter sp. TaxID=2906452 RepID=UPI002ABAA6B2|nr:heparinase II/III family protein [Allopontixanthobacter sp.]MDZ4306878.1 heparinase II/III family protein [Allopontixanthobacter sp.]